MYTQLRRIVWTFSLLLFVLSQSFASHFAAADLSYTCLDAATNKYFVRLTLYRDCAGAGAPTSAQICAEAPSCGIFATTYTLPQEPCPPPPPGLLDCEISPICQSFLGQTACNASPGIYPGFQGLNYSDTIILPQVCADWKFSWDQCCRNGAITNLATTPSLYIEATLNQLAGGCNSSPSFTNMPILYICPNVKYNYNHGIVEPDGDSLHFELQNPLDAQFLTGRCDTGTPILFNAPNTATYPVITTTGTFPMNANTGQMTFTPSVTQVAVASVRVREYRNKVLIGSVMRDLQINVINLPNPSNCLPDTQIFTGIDSILSIGPIQLDSISIEACPGDSVVFIVPARADSLFMSSNVALAIPGASFVVKQINIDSAVGTFRWLPQVNDTGLNIFTLELEARSCPFVNKQTFGIGIDVLPGTYAGADRSYCPAGGPIQLNVAGGTMFTWKILYGDTSSLSCLNCPNPISTPSVHTLYEVTSDLSGTCKNKDTVLVERVPDFVWNVTTSEDTICRFDTTILNAVTDPVWAPYTFSWSPPDSLNDPFLGTPSAFPATSTMYAVTVTSDTGCRIVDSVFVFVEGEIPSIEILGYDTICQGDSATLDAYTCTGNILWDNFDPGIDASQWDNIQGAIAAGICGSISGTRSLYFNTTVFGSVRQAESNDLDLTLGGTIDFWIFVEKGFGGCGDPVELGEDIILEYSTNGGGTWVTINSYNKGNDPFRFRSVQIPPPAQTASTRIRWRQDSWNFGDNWALDDVQIKCCGSGACITYDYAWSPGTGISSTSISNPFFFPANNTSYTVTVTPVGTECAATASVDVVVAPDFNVSIDPVIDTICLGESVQLVATGDAGAGPFSYSWNPPINLSDSTAFNPIATATGSTVYTVRLQSQEGCRNYADATIIVNGEVPDINFVGYPIICEGDQTQIFAEACAIDRLYDDFDSKASKFKWDVNTGNRNATCGFVSAPDALWFNTPFGLTREAQTYDLDVSGGGEVEFWLKMPATFGIACTDPAEITEFIELQYSTNGGGTWVTINSYLPDGTYDDWEFITEQIPVGAQSFNTKFRWVQVAHNFGDQWAIDNVKIKCCGQSCANYVYQWTPSQGVSDPNIADPFFSPIITTEYIVSVGSFGSDCFAEDTITVTVAPDFTLVGPFADPDTICKNGLSQLDMSIIGPGQFDYQWTPGASLNDSTIKNPLAGPILGTSYSVTVTSPQGCRKVDSVNVFVQGEGAQVRIEADRNYVCPGDTINLTADVSAIPCDLYPNLPFNCFAIPNSQFLQSDIGNDVLVSFSESPYQWFPQNRVQYLFRASELQAMGMSGGTLTDLGLNIDNKGSSAFENFTIKMGCTTDDELTNDFVDGLQTVFLPKLHNTVFSGWNMHNFDQPYNWDGFSNVIVEICYENSGGNFGTNDDVYYSNTTFNSVTYVTFASGTSGGCSIDAPGFFLQNSGRRPNMRFVSCTYPPPAIGYTWVPTTGMSNPNDLNTSVVLNKTTTYVLHADDSSCRGSGAITLYIDSGYYAYGGPDTVLCNGDDITLNGEIVGNPPRQTFVTCFASNTQCDTASATYMVQDPPTFATNTPFYSNTTQFLPNIIEDQRSQILVRATELEAQGMGMGVITEVSLYIEGKQSTAPFQNLTIGIGCTPDDDLSAGTWLPVTNVYNAATYTTDTGWNTFTFQTTFDWDGISNLVVQLCYDNPNGGSANGTDTVLTAFTPGFWVGYMTNINWGATGCNLPPNTNNLTSARPVVRFSHCPPPIGDIFTEWLPGPLANPINITPTGQEIYVFHTEFINGCEHYDTVVLDVGNLNYTISNDTVICIGRGAQLRINGGATHTWDNIPGLSCYNCPNPVANPDSTTTYSVTIESADGCVNREDVTVYVVDLLAVPWFVDTLLEQPTELILGVDVTTNPPNVPFQILWNPQDYMDNNTITTPTIIPLSSTLYEVVITSNGCIIRFNVNVRLLETPIVIPGAFSPNGDGQNEEFYPIGKNNQYFNLSAFRVFNRWGQMIHDDPTQPWDGTYKGEIQPVGTYIYFVEVNRPDRVQNEVHQGSISLFR